MKTVYFDENIFKSGMLKEAVISSTLPKEYRNISDSGVFPFGHSLSFPDFYEEPFCLRILSQEYAKSKENIISLKSIDDVSSDNISTALSEITTKILDKERNSRDLLEKMCLNYVIDLFNIPEDMIKMDLKLSDSINNNESILQLDPEDSYGTFKDLSDADLFKKELDKRRIINLLICGAAFYYSKNIKPFLENLFDIDANLGKLYKEEGILNRYLILSTPKIELTEKDKKVSGVVDVKLGTDSDMTVISSKATNFPILLYETVKGLMELFASHGLPKDKWRASAIIKKSDYVKAEIWGMRIGPALWELFINACDNIESQKIPYVFMEFCSLTPSKFSRISKEIFAGTERGKKLMKEIIDNVDYGFFIDKLGKAKLDKSVIEDEYISPEEL